MKETLLRTVQNIDWITIILFFSVAAIVLAKSFFYVRFNNFIFLDSSHEKSPFLFYTIVGLLLLFFLVKILLHLTNAFVFNISGIVSEFLFKNITYLNYSGFIMFMANILLTYVLRDSKTVVYISALLIILINAIGWVIVIRNYQKLITNNFFYFILYLCALEITPLVLIGDYFKD